MKNNSSTSKFFFNVSLVALAATMALTASVMTGCGDNSGEVSKATEVVHETQVVTRVVDGAVVDENGYVLDEQGTTTGETVPIDKKDSKQSGASNSNKNGNSSSKQSGNTQNKQSSQKSGSTQNKQSNQQSGGVSGNNGSAGGSAQMNGSGSASKSKTNNNNNNNTNKNTNQNNNSNKQSGSNKSNNNNNQNNNNSSSVLKIDGKRFNKGDTVVCTYNVLNASEKLINFQGVVKYDGSYLKVKTARLENSAGNSGLLNYNLNQEIRFNGSNLNGFNYTKEKPFLTVEYEVLKGGSTNPKLVWQVITGMSDKKYCTDNGTLTNGFKCTHTYAKS